MTTATQAAATAAHSGSAATEAFRESVTRRETAAADPARTSFLARDLLSRIHDVIREHHLTYPEYQAAKQWLIEVGQSAEWPLFLDVFVEHVVEDLFRRPFQRVAEAAAAGAVKHVHVAGGDTQAGKLRRHMLHVGRPRHVVDVDLADGPGPAAEYAPGYVMMALVLMGDEGVGEDPLRLDHADAAAGTAGAGHDVVAQLVAVADHG